MRFDHIHSPFTATLSSPVLTLINNYIGHFANVTPPPHLSANFKIVGNQCMQLGIQLVYNQLISIEPTISFP